MKIGYFGAPKLQRAPKFVYIVKGTNHERSNVILLVGHNGGGQDRKEIYLNGLFSLGLYGCGLTAIACLLKIG